MKINRDGDTSDTDASNDTSSTTGEGSGAPSGDGAPSDGSEAGVLEGSFDEGSQPTADGPLGSFFDGSDTEQSGSFDAERAADGSAVGQGDDGENESQEGETQRQAAEGEAQDDEPEANDEAETAGGEDADRQARREEWLGQVQEETGIQAESTDELAEEVNRLKTQNEGFHELEQIVESNPGFQQMLSEMADGKTVAEAAAALDGVSTEAPDPNENPEAYADWKAAQKMKEREMEQEREQQSERQQKIQREQRRMQAEFENVVENNDLSDDQAQALGETLARLTVTQPGAQLRAKDLETLRKGMQFDQAVEQAREDAYQKGREEALQEVRGDGSVQPSNDLPNLRTAGGSAENEQTSDVGDEELGAMFGPSQRDATSLHGRV